MPDTVAICCDESSTNASAADLCQCQSVFGDVNNDNNYYNSHRATKRIS